MRWKRQLSNSQKRVIVVIIAAILLVSIRIVWPLVFSGYEQPRAVHGELDLRQWDFQKKGTVKLNGEWAFAANHLVSPTLPYTSFPETGFIKVPGLWNHSFDENHATYLGFATYRLHILLPKQFAGPTTNADSAAYAIRVMNIRSSHTLFVNAALVGNNGLPAESKAKSTPDNYPYTAFVTITGNQSQEAVVILHVANFVNNAGGGILLPLEFGTAAQILASTQHAAISDTSIIVLFLMIAVFCGILFSYQPKQSYLLYFALFCISSSLLIAVSNEKLLLSVFPLSFNLYTKLLFLSTVGKAFFCYMFIVRMYPEFAWSIPLRIVKIVCGCVAFLFLFTDITVYTGVQSIWFILMELIVVYLLALLFRAVWSHREDAPYFFLAGIASLSNGITYIMFTYDIILPYAPPIDLFIFALSLTLLVANRFVETIEKVESLSLQRLRMEMAFLQVQIKPHFLFNSLNTIGSFIEIDPDRAQELLGEFSTYLRFSFDFINLEPTVPFDREWTLVEAYLRLEQARYGEALSVSVDVDHARGLRLPPLSLQPLVENAIRHGVMMRSEGGSIWIKAEVIEDEVELTVADNGVGISADRLDHLFVTAAPNETIHASEANGIGLFNIQHRLIHTYGKGLNISSTTHGTIVKFRIPQEGE